MTLQYTVVTSGIKFLTGVLCRIHAEELRKIPAAGPLILAVNHINSIEVPIVCTQLLPRPITGFVKTETWDNPFMGYLFDLWGGIPIKRGEADIQAMRAGLRALEQGKILAVALEGTRSGHGRLLPGHPGAVMLALMSGAPIMPLVYYGHVHFNQNLKRIKRTDIYMKVGRLFYLNPDGVRVTSAIRKVITEEIMYQIAALLPADMRGVYSDLSLATEHYLDFQETSSSNILQRKNNHT